MTATFEGQTHSAESANTTTHTVSIGDGTVTGDVVFVAFTEDSGPGDTITWPSGWTTSFLAQDNTSAGNIVRTEIHYRQIDGTEGFTGIGDTISITTGNSENSVHQSWRYAAGTFGTIYGTSVGDGSTSATPDPPSLSPAGGSDDYSWIAYYAGDNGNPTTDAYPTNYASNQDSHTSGGAGGVHCAMATRALTASSEDPGTFTQSTSTAWVAFTIAVAPAAAGDTFNMSYYPNISRRITMVPSGQAKRAVARAARWQMFLSSLRAA